MNARIVTADPARPRAEALAIRGDRVVALGTTAEIAARAGERTISRDLAGRTVVPGFNDAHVVDPGPGAELRAFARNALAAGVTSMQWFVSDRTVGDAAAALLAADTPLRVRLLRMPRPGGDGSTVDSRPHLPPQPSARLDVRGMGFRLGPVDSDRLRQAVSWAYGSEDSLAIEPMDESVASAYVEAIERTGLPEVWSSKRPRIERAGAAAVELIPRLRTNGVVVVQRPEGARPLRSLVESGVHVALASGTGADPFGVLAWATSPELGPEALSIDQALTAMTRGSAYAEREDRDKGHLTVGARADLAVMSVDPFTAPPGELRRARSVLTVIGGQVVHDVP